MEMASSPTLTALGAPSDSDMATLGGIEALNLKVGPVRRNLFGPVDHRQLQQDFQRLLSLSVEVATKRWSFDFQGDRPTPGSAVQWEEVRCQDVPAFYRTCAVRHSSAGVSRGLGSNGALKRRSASPASPSLSSDEGSPGSSSSSSGSGDEYLELATRRCYRLQRPIKRKQANITDFFRVKKRRFLHYKGSSRQ